MKAAKPVSALKLAGAAAYIAAWPTLMFLVAGNGRWVEGWLFAGWFLALSGARDGFARCSNTAGRRQTAITAKNRPERHAMAGRCVP